MSNLDRQMSLRKKASSAMEKLDVLEAQMEDVLKNLPQLAIGFNQQVNQLNQQIQELTETVDAIVGLVGVNEVQRAIGEARLARMKAAAESTKVNIAKAVTEGKLLKAEKIGERTLMVGREVKADGTEVPPGYSALGFGQVKKEYKDKLLGQTVGFQLETENGGKFEIQELYESAPVAPPVAAAPAPEAVPDATAAATPPPAPAEEAAPAPVGTGG